MIKNESNFTPKNTGILLISHGSRHPLASETFNKIADMFRKESDFKVNVGYMEIHKPNIPTALNELVKDTKIKTVIAVPVFLAPGIHTTKDIPKILGLNDDKKENKIEHNHNHHHDSEKVNFDGKIIYTKPLGADPLVLEIIKSRINNTLKSP